MADLRTAAQQALEVLENAEDQLAKPYSTDASNAITALRAALAQQAEPVSLMNALNFFTEAERLALWKRGNYSDSAIANITQAVLNKIRTSPPQRPAEPVQPAIPLENSREARQAIEEMLAEYDHPTNPNNAARAGWRAARLYAAPQQQAEPVQFDPAEAMRLAEEFAQMKQAHGVFCNAGSRRLMEEAHSALASYLGIKEKA